MDNKTIRQKYGMFVWIFLMIYRILMVVLGLSCITIFAAMIFGLPNLAWKASGVSIVISVMLMMFVFPYLLAVTEIYIYPR